MVANPINSDNGSWIDSVCKAITQFWATTIRHTFNARTHTTRRTYTPSRMLTAPTPVDAPLQARDFDPHSLRKTLPSAVSSVHHALASEGRVYVHCTAGLGRAPAVCIAYMFWFLGMDLDTAYKVRGCLTVAWEPLRPGEQVYQLLPGVVAYGHTP